MALQPGSRIGAYEVIALIGEGGMGRVFRARDTKLNREVALKVLPDSFANDADRLARFTREAQTLASLNHPNIAHIHGLEESRGVRALVMELVEGEDLSQRIARGPIPADEALPIARQIVEALEAAHEQGIIHRDLKPANVKVRPDGTVKVLDFGLAKALDPIVPASVNVTSSPTITSPALMTGVGMLLGTAAYMSPEQARGKAVDRRSDIWAFGCVLYEMLTGERAFAGEDVSETLANVLKVDPNWNKLPANTPSRVRTALRNCLQTDSKRRFGDMQSVRLALDGAFESPNTQAVAEKSVWRLALPLVVAFAGGALLVMVSQRTVPTVATQPVARFEYALPNGRQFRNMTRHVVALSSNGRHFVYNANDGLYVRTLGELEGRLIPGTADVLTNPFLSPDGQFVGYFQGNQLKRLPIGGGLPVAICPAMNPWGVSWAHDNTIWFGQPAGIMRVPADGGAPDLVIAANEGEQVFGPQLLPDGESVLFSTTMESAGSRWNEGRVVVQSISTGKRTVVVGKGTDGRYLPSGHLVYSAEGGLFGVAFDISRLETKGSAVPLIKGVQQSIGLNRTGASHYAVSDNGTLAYLADSAAFLSVLWADRKGTTTAINEMPVGGTRGHVCPQMRDGR